MSNAGSPGRRSSVTRTSGGKSGVSTFENCAGLPEFRDGIVIIDRIVEWPLLHPTKMHTINYLLNTLWTVDIVGYVAVAFINSRNNVRNMQHRLKMLAARFEQPIRLRPLPRRRIIC